MTLLFQFLLLCSVNVLQGGSPAWLFALHTYVYYHLQYLWSHQLRNHQAVLHFKCIFYLPFPCKAAHNITDCDHLWLKEVNIHKANKSTWCQTSPVQGKKKKKEPAGKATLANVGSIWTGNNVSSFRVIFIPRSKLLWYAIMHYWYQWGDGVSVLSYQGTSQARVAPTTQNETHNSQVSWAFGISIILLALASSCLELFCPIPNWLCLCPHLSVRSYASDEMWHVPSGSGINIVTNTTSFNCNLQPQSLCVNFTSNLVRTLNHFPRAK